MFCRKEEEIKAEDIKEILFYLDPLIRSSGAQANAETLMRSLQETDGGWGQYRLASVLRTRLKTLSFIFCQEMTSRRDIHGAAGSWSNKDMENGVAGLLTR